MDNIQENPLNSLTSRIEVILTKIKNHIHNNDSFEIGHVIGLLCEKCNISSTQIEDALSMIYFYKDEKVKSFDSSVKCMKDKTLDEDTCRKLRFNQNFTIPSVLSRYEEYNPDNVGKMVTILLKNRKLNRGNVTVTMTTCKRFDLFYRTVSSFLNCCTDLENIDEWIVVDDSSSMEDKKNMIHSFPFIKFIFKSPEDKGHPKSMNIVRDLVKTKYIFHIEDDWLFFRREPYISQCIKVLESNEKYGQCLLNRLYGERERCHDIFGGIMKYTNGIEGGTRECIRYYEHEFYRDEELKKIVELHSNKKTCFYWPHYSLRVGMTKKSVYDTIGRFNESSKHFEMDYAYRYVEKYITTYLDNIFCYHIGRCTFERDTDKLNAYDLNSEQQFGEQPKTNVEKDEEKVEKDKFVNKEFKLNSYEKSIDKVVNKQEFNKTNTSDTANTTVKSYNINNCLTDEEKKIPPYFDPNIEEPITEPTIENKLETGVEPTINPTVKKPFKLKTYVLNMKRRPERLKQFVLDNHDELEKLQYEVFEAVDGQEMKPYPRLLKLFENGDYNYRRGILGCASSHINMWMKFIVNSSRGDIDTLLVLEDDITLSKNFISKLSNSLEQLPRDDWDILFLGHFLYPQYRKNEDRSDRMPYVTQWDKKECEKYSMGGTIGYVISRIGAIKLLKYINENGMYNAIDWVMFKTADILNIYYCYPHIVYSECVTNEIKPHSDIQYDTTSLCIEDLDNNIDTGLYNRLLKEFEYYMTELGESGVNFNSEEYREKYGCHNEKSKIVYNDNYPDRDSILQYINFTKRNEVWYSEFMKKIEDLPVEYYSIQDKYIVTIPKTKLNCYPILKNITTGNNYLNLNFEI